MRKWVRIRCTDRDGNTYNEGVYGEDTDWQSVWHKLIGQGHTVTVTVTQGTVQLKEFSGRMVV